MSIDWGETRPADNDLVSQYPADERVHRGMVKSAFGLEHDVINGRHQFPGGTTAQRDAINTWGIGSLFVNLDDPRGRLQFSNSAGIPTQWNNIGQEFQAGVVMIFMQATAPVGWVQVDWQDYTIRLIGIGDTSGGNAGGDWTISGFSLETNQHTHGVNGLTGAENQNHTHAYSGTTDPSANPTQGTSPSGGPTTPLGQHSHTYGGATGIEQQQHNHSLFLTTSTESIAHTHTHDGTWRPRYINGMAAQKQ